MADQERIVAIGLLTERDLAVLGQGFRRLYRVEDGGDFSSLLAAIDVAERDHLMVQEQPAPKLRIRP